MDYIRVLAVFMILYDHIGAFRNPEWGVKKIVDFFICSPLNIIQDFGAFGVSIFFVISGFLFTTNAHYEHSVCKRLLKILHIYLSGVIAFLAFWGVQAIVWLFKDTYWHQFSPGQWVESMTLVGYINGHGDVINGSTWFLLPLFLFYLLSILYSVLHPKIGNSAAWIVEIVTVILFAVFYFIDAAFGTITATSFVFVFMPISGMILGELYKGRKNDVQKPYSMVLLLIVNFCLLVYGVYRFNPIYYTDQKYLVSYVIAFLLIAVIPLFESYFKESGFVAFVCKIGLSIYLLQMTWGSFIMQLFSDIDLPFTISFIITIAILVALSYLHYSLVEKRLLGFLLKKPKKKTSKKSPA